MKSPRDRKKHANPPGGDSIAELTASLLDASEADRPAAEAALRGRLATEADVRGYVAAVELHALLQTAHAPEDALSAAAPGGGGANAETGGCREDVCGAEIAELWGLFDEAAAEFDRSQPAPRSTRAAGRRGWAAALAAVAAVVCVALAVDELFRAPAVAGDGSIGVVTNATGARWLGPPVHQLPFKVHPGESLALERGVAELSLTSGVVVVIRGPAEIDVLSPMRVRARSGAVRARVSESAKGFVIEAPTTDVIDLGTEFGVDIDPSSGSTDVVVFEGKVDLQYVAGRGGPAAQRLASTPASLGLGLLQAGEGLRVEASGRTSRIVAIHSENYPAMAGAGWAAPREPLIREVSDTLRSPGATQYYQIVHRGFREDARAFVDRLHEWNGDDAQGLPAYLLGGDYVQTFNSDKLETDLRITIDLSVPAMLYVLFDRRVDPPGWLRESFVPTGDSVGVDEALPGGQNGVVRDVGPGESIDTTHSVWARRCEAAGPVVLGGLREENVRTSMYGVVATPIATPIASVLAPRGAPNAAEIAPPTPLATDPSSGPRSVP